jgi:hypothetical protein
MFKLKNIFAAPMDAIVGQIPRKTGEPLQSTHAPITTTTNTKATSTKTTTTAASTTITTTTVVTDRCNKSDLEKVSLKI